MEDPWTTRERLRQSRADFAGPDHCRQSLGGGVTAGVPVQVVQGVQDNASAYFLTPPTNKRPGMSVRASRAREEDLRVADLVLLVLPGPADDENGGNARSAEMGSGRQCRHCRRQAEAECGCGGEA